MAGTVILENDRTLFAVAWRAGVVASIQPYWFRFAPEICANDSLSLRFLGVFDNHVHVGTMHRRFLFRFALTLTQQARRQV